MSDDKLFKEALTKDSVHVSNMNDYEYKTVYYIANLSPYGRIVSIKQETISFDLDIAKFLYDGLKKNAVHTLDFKIVKGNAVYNPNTGKLRLVEQYECEPVENDVDFMKIFEEHKNTKRNT
jgi:hypothetical protein